MLTVSPRCVKLARERNRMSTSFATTSPSIFSSSVPRTRAAFLMCPPTLYDVDYVINPWMSGNVHASSRARATAQWQRLYAELSDLGDILLIDSTLR